MEPVHPQGRRPAEYDVFLSYASEDRAWCRRLAERLRGQGIRVWVDFWELKPGDHLEARLNEGLERSRKVVALFSRSYFRQDKCWTLAESYSKQHADVLARERPLIPLLIEDCKVKPTLASLIYVDFRRPADFEARFHDLVQALDVPPAPASSSPGGPVGGPTDVLEAAHQELERRQLASLPVEDIKEQILEAKRRLRAGGRLQPGDILGGRYRLAEPIGQGGFGTVWRAYDRSRSCVVALKVLHGDKTQDASQVTRFFRGAARMAELSHPAIAKIVEPRRQEDSFHYYVMEYLGGGDLRAAVLGRRITRPAIIPLICEIGAGLQHAHEAGLVHRDVKPANIILDGAGRAKLTDFDLVRAADTTGGTRTGMLGTFIYAAPECLDQAKNAGPPADVYSLGMTAVFALHGGDLPSEAFKRPEAFIDKLDCARSLKRVLQRAVEEEPSRRFDSCKAFCAQLQEAASGVPGDLAAAAPATGTTGSPLATGEPGLEADPPTEPGAKVPRRSLAWLLAALALLLAAGGGYALWRTPATVAPPPVPGGVVTEKGGELVPIPGGKFLMGSPPAEVGRYDDEGQHEVEVKPFFLARYPVTNEQYARFLKENPEIRKPAFWNDETYNQPRQSVVGVSWDEAVAFAKWAGGRLPTEAEWEYAARAGTTTATYAGNLTSQVKDPMLDDIAWYGDNSGGRPRPVGEKKPNAWGLYDMLGNVWQWCSDWYGPYGKGPVYDPQGPEAGSARVVRGGSWLSDARLVRAANRLWFTPGSRIDYLGFRWARGQGAP